MSKESNHPDDENDRRGGNFKVPLRTYLLWIVIVLAIPLLMIFRNNNGPQAEQLTQAQFIKKLESDLITRGEIIYDPQSPYLHEVRGKYVSIGSSGQPMLDSGGKPVEVNFTTKIRFTDGLEEKLLSSGKFDIRQPNTMLLGIVYSLFPILVIALLIWFFFIRQIRKVGAQFTRAQRGTLSSLDLVLTESASQLAKPREKLFVRMFLPDGEVIEGRLLWVAREYLKYESSEGDEVIVPKAIIRKFKVLDRSQSVR
ncbi:MAG TPA: ATP-dependent metallopeptidase FtsH/Yme1/Tma family protein [Verrucomicrobiae bacterium]|nr:ATP-dependent metallopeptidase FtsH/Yme1/Tma family protein [Verrucomicrobiae bacterium]